MVHNHEKWRICNDGNKLYTFDYVEISLAHNYNKLQFFKKSKGKTQCGTLT